MYKYLIAFSLLTPFLGILIVEGGERALSVGIDGYPNGATAAFGVFAAVLIVVAYLSSRPIRLGRSRIRAAHPPEHGPAAAANGTFPRFARRLTLINLASLLLILFAFGGINVLLGTVGKGVFRTSFGPLGAIPFLLTKFLLPALLAYGTLKYLQAPKTQRNQLLYAVNVLLVFAVGASWGYKTTSMMMLLPSLLLRYWRVRPTELLKLGAAATAILVCYFLWFDSRQFAVASAHDVFRFLWLRLTVLQGDVAWHVWGQFRSGAVFPDYLPTLAAAVGDRVLVAAGVSPDNLADWMGYHYDWMINYVANVPLDLTASGHSISGTPFSEGIIAGGIAGVLGFAVLGGLIVGVIYRVLGASIASQADKRAAILATFFCFPVFSWLHGGGITQLVHVSVWVNIAMTWMLFRLLESRGARAQAVDSTMLELHRRAAAGELTHSGRSASLARDATRLPAAADRGGVR